MHSPLPSEAEAFRWVVIIGTGAALVIGAALIDPTLGVIVMAALLAIGATVIWVRSRGTEPSKAELAQRDDAVWRVLVIANRTVGGKELLDEIANRSRGRAAEIHVVTPALPSSKLDHWASDTDAATDAARERLDASIAAIEGHGLQATGSVGDSDPNVAIRDALVRFPADELIVSTLPPDRSKWIEHGVVERARTEVDLPITHVVVDLEATSA